MIKLLEIGIKLTFAPWYFLCYGVGKFAETSGVEKYRSPQEQAYDKEMMRRAEDGLKDIFK